MSTKKTFCAVLIAGWIIGNLPQAMPDGFSGMSLNEQVSELEQEVLSQTYTTDPLPIRVTRLEANIIPKDRLLWQNKPLPDRINHLVSIIPIPSVLKNFSDSKVGPGLIAQPGVAGPTPEEQRFQQAKQQRRKDMALVYIGYITSVTQNVARSWQSVRTPAQGSLLVTKVKVSLDGSGKLIRLEGVARSASSAEDKAVEDLILKSNFPPLPAGLKTLDLFWTFMSDGSLNILEYTESPEADKYNMDLVGVVFKANGVTRGTGGMQAVTGVDYGPYMADLQRRIKRAWIPARGFESKRVAVGFKVQRGGAISNLQLDQSSGVAIADEAALRAVENASPFKPLPAGGRDELDIQFVFDYNMFSGGGHATIR